MIGTVGRRLGGLGVALALAGALAGAPGAAPVVRAAEPDLAIVTDARYDVQPAEHRVRVTLKVVLTNNLKDTVTKRYYFDQAFLAVLPNTSGFRFTWAGEGKPEVHVTKHTPDYTLLRLDLAQRLFSGRSATYTLRFDLPDPGGEPTRDVRIGETLVSFPVWAFASDSTPGSTVEVVFPPGFEVVVDAGEIPEPRTNSDGEVVFQTGALPKPLSFFAYLVADRPGAYDESTVTTRVRGDAVPLTMRAWPDDPDWASRVGDLMRQALPDLANRIGLDWPRDGGLVVQEAASRSTGGYSGLFDPKEGVVEVAYYADEFVILHEAAHTWFNGSLLADRWANEGFASHYALQAAGDLGIAAQGDELTDELEAAAIPLNEWGPVGRETTATEDYAYAASLLLAGLVADRAGEPALRAVWADAAAEVGAYQPPGPAAAAGSAGAAGSAADGEPETVDGPPDWRGLLDLLDEHGQTTFDDLWELFVVRDSDRPLIEARREARAQYEEVVAAAGDWQLPRPVRDAMRAWQFETATALLTDATELLEQRSAIETAAAANGLTPPATLHTTFELPDGFRTAGQEATAELNTIRLYEAAAATRPAEPDPLQVLGMWGTTPDDDLALARDLFARGDLAGASDAAGDAATIWTTAEDVGRGRLVSIVALSLAALLAILMVIGSVRARRRRRRRYAARWVGPDPYATLAATHVPPTPGGDGEEDDRGARLD